MQVSDRNKNTRSITVLAVVCFILQIMLTPQVSFGGGVINFALIFSAAIALSQRILSEGEPAVKDYIGYLSGGCSKTPIELLRGAGVDMATPDPVNAALKYFGELVDQLEQELN